MTTRLNPCGFVVLESCDDYEQILGLDLRPQFPPGGVLRWADKGVGKGRVFFGTKSAARAAIKRTEHYRLAFGDTTLPTMAYCRIEMIALVEKAP